MVADDFAKRCERQQRCHQSNLIDIHHPDDIGWADMQISSNSGESDVRDRGVERRHRKLKIAAAAQLRRSAGRLSIAAGLSAAIVSVDIRKGFQSGSM